MIEFRNCCFCVPLRIGCLILGYLHLIASLIRVVDVIVSLVTVGTLVATSNVNGSAVAAFIAIYVIVLILVTELLNFSVLLVIGIHKDRRGYVKANWIYYLIYIVLYAIMFLVRCSTLATDVGYIIGTIIHILLSVYFLLVIRSYWVTMGNNVNSVV